MHPIVLYILLRNVEPSSSKNTLITNFAFSPAFNQLVRNYIQALSLKKCSGIACALWSSCVKSVFTGQFFLASNIYFLLCVLLLPLPASLFFISLINLFGHPLFWGILLEAFISPNLHICPYDICSGDIKWLVEKISSRKKMNNI